jgi:hypothetical protein
MDSFRDFPHPPKRLKPVEKMLLQELMHLVVVVKLSTTLLKMLDPVKACILNLRRKTALNLTAFDVSNKNTGIVQVTDVLL